MNALIPVDLQLQYTPGTAFPADLKQDGIAKLFQKSTDALSHIIKN